MDERKKRADELLVNALFDGELTPEKEAGLKEKLESDGIALEPELDDLRLIRSELRQWFHEDYFEARHKVDIWKRIAPEITAEAARRANRVNWFEELRERIASFFPREQLAPFVGVGVAAALVLFVVGRGPGNDKILNTEELATKQVAELTPIMGGGVQSGSNLSTVGVDSPGGRQVIVNRGLNSSSGRVSESRSDSLGPDTEVPVLSVSDSAIAAYRDRLQRREEIRLARMLVQDGSLAGGAPKISSSVSAKQQANQEVGVRLPSPGRQILDRQFVLGGLRTRGVDIHWMSSDRAVDFVPTPGSDEPPVIWVSQSK